MNKRGIGHVEIILSFVMFSIFVVTVLYLFNPLDRSKMSDASLVYVYQQVVNNISTDVDIYTIIVNRTAMEEENYISEYLNVKIDGIDTSDNVRAENYTGNILKAKRGNGDEIYIEIEQNNIVILKFSEDFTPAEDFPGDTCNCPHSPEFYTIASSRTEKVIFENKIIDLKKSYENNYNLLKNQIGLSPREDFLFNLTLGSVSIGVNANVPQGSEMFSTTVRKEVLKNTGESVFGELIVRTW